MSYNTNNMGRALSYAEVLLVPKYSVLRSRSNADLSVELLGRVFRAPICPSNMSSVINPDIARWLDQNGYPHIMHRFGDTYSYIRRANIEDWRTVSISVGVKDEDKELLRRISAEKLRVDWITIDIANGHSELMKEMIQFIRGIEFRQMGSFAEIVRPSIIAGNVATPDAVYDLVQWGADCVKCGISNGSVCSTRHNTGFCIPSFTCSYNCAHFGGTKNSENFFGDIAQVPLILDGGIRENGDIAKALVAAGGVPSLVMLGGVLAACVDAPGENVYGNRAVIAGETGVDEIKGKITHKRFYGSASERQKGEKKHVEGVEIDLPCNGLTYAEKYKEIEESLASAVSYAGGTSIEAFKNVEWVEVGK